VSSELFDALRAADPTTPPLLETFDRVVAGSEPRPDFYEYSVHTGDSPSPHRLTYYFDTYRRGASVAREAGERFVRLGAELGVAIPEVLTAFARSDALLGNEVLQLVLGVDGHPDPSRLRSKYYLVFRDNPFRCVTELLRVCGNSTPDRAEPAKVYILGVDVAASGLQDIKLYYRLEPARVGGVIENDADVATLVATSRQIVFLQCVRQAERRQIYLHAESSVALSGWLLEHGYGDALERAQAVNARLPGSRIEPRIVSLPYERGRVSTGQGSVYFHFATRGF
jgi:hypothetical protein